VSKLSLSTKTVVGLTAVSMLGAAVALYHASQVHIANQRIASDQAEMLAAVHVGVAFLREHEYLGAYLMDGGDRDRLRERLAGGSSPAARGAGIPESSDAPSGPELAARFRTAAAQYRASRDEIIALHDRGEREAARAAYLGEASRRYRQGAAAFAEMVARDTGAIQQALTLGSAQARRVRALLTISLVLVGLLGTVSIWLLFAGVFRPLRRMTEDCRSRLPAEDRGGQTGRRGDLTALGYYLSALMSEAAETRAAQERGRSGQRHSERLAAIGNVAARVAHDIKNALTSIGGFARFIERRPFDAERVKEEAQIILRVAARLERMVRETLEFSSPFRLKPEVQSFANLVRDAVLPLAAQAPTGVTLDLALDPATPEASFDPAYMEQVVTNLVGNALEAVGPGGHVRVETGEQRGGAQLTVRDDGPGIPPEVRARLFEPFFTTKQKGNGLGLAISRQIVADHGGAIEFHSSPDQGATFTVALPPPRRASTDRTTRTCQPGRQVLICSWSSARITPFISNCSAGSTSSCAAPAGGPATAGRCT